MSGEPIEIAIVGGGIGGLILACALERRRLPWSLYERAAELRPAGAGITVQINAMRALGGIGLAEVVAQAGNEIHRADIATDRGRVLARSSMQGLVAELGAPMIAIHRARLQKALVDQLPPERIHLGHELASLAQDTNLVRGRFQNGEEIRARVLVGADGLHSSVRSHLLGDGPPEYAGYTSWRGVAPEVPGVKPHVVEYWGRGARFGVVPIGHGEIYWFAVADAPAGGHDDDPRTAVLTLFGDWTAPIPSLIAATPPSSVLRTDICDRPTRATWSKGRLILLGDAAHPMTPNLGQGGCMAIEDAVVLARCLASYPDHLAAAREYERLRIGRANGVVESSRKLGSVGQWRNPIATWFRDTAMRLTPERVVRDGIRTLAAFEDG